MICCGIDAGSRLIKVLLLEPASGHVLAADSTVVPHAGLCWLFAGVSPVPWEPANDYLHVFYSEDPIRGAWTPHPLNPVVSDVRRARPAGPIVGHEGRLFRPSQDCSGRYGSGIRINEIVRLTVEDYEESEQTVIRPDRERGFVATHTIAVDGELTVMDAMRLVPRFRWPLMPRILRGIRDGRAARQGSSC